MVKQRNIWLVLLDFILIAITVCLSLSLLFGLIARWVSPQTMTFFAFFALGAPLLYFANLFVFCVWIIRWKWWALCPGFVLLFGVGNIGEFVQVQWLKEYHGERSSGELAIMTYNVHNFDNSIVSIEQVGAKSTEVASDVLFLQEYMIADSSQLARFDKAFENYPYRVYQYDVTSSFSHNGQIIMSRYKLSTARTIHFEGSDNSIVVVDLYTTTDTLRLFGCHLQTTAFNAVSRGQGLRSMVENEKSDSLARTAISALSENFRLRAIQADTLRTMIEMSPYSVVVAGDFNSPPLTYTYSTIRGRLADAFCEQGSGYGYTYKPLRSLFRIDYVLFDDNTYKATSYLSPDLPYSDHNPVMVRLKKR